jgi:hypothetical protein
MEMREFINQVIDQVEASQEAIAELQKQAAEAEAKPAFSEEVLSQTAEKLVESGLLSKRASDDLVQSFRESPDQALLSLQKVVNKFAAREDAPASLGAPSKLKKNAAKADPSKPESDKAWEAGFGNGA